jgi:hypothetical protein
VVLAVIAALGLTGWPEVSSKTAGTIAIVGLGCYLAGALWFGVRRVTTSEQREVLVVQGIRAAFNSNPAAQILVTVIRWLLGKSEEELARLVAEGYLLGLGAFLRALGLPLLALGFFGLWTLSFMGLWALDATQCGADPGAAGSCGAFLGIDAKPAVGDFVYFAVNVAFANLPPDFIAHSDAAHTLVTLEVVSGVALITAFAADFLKSPTAAAAGAAEVADPPPDPNAG